MPNHVKNLGFVHRTPLKLKDAPDKIPLSDTRHDFDATPYVKHHPAGRQILREHSWNACPALAALHGKRPQNRFKSLTPLRTTVPVPMSPIASPTFFPSESSSQFLRIDRQTGKPCRADGSTDISPKQQQVLSEVTGWMENEDLFACAAGRLGQFGSDHVFSICEHPVDSPEAAAQMTADTARYMEYQSEKWRQGNYFPCLIFVFPNDDSTRKKELAEDSDFVHLTRELADLCGNMVPEIENLGRKEGASKFKRGYLFDQLYSGSDRKGRQSPHTVVGLFATAQFDYAAHTLQLNALRKATNKRERKISGSHVTPNQLALYFPVPKKLLEKEIGYITDSARHIAEHPTETSVYRLFELFKRYRHHMTKEECAIVLPAIVKNFGMALAQINRVAQLDVAREQVEPDDSKSAPDDFELREMFGLVFQHAESPEQTNEFCSDIIHACLNEVKKQSKLAYGVAQIAAVAGGAFTPELAIKLLTGTDMANPMASVTRLADGTVHPRKRKRESETVVRTTSEDVLQAIALLNKPIVDVRNLNPDIDAHAMLRDKLLSPGNHRDLGFSMRTPIGLGITHRAVLRDMDRQTQRMLQTLVNTTLAGKGRAPAVLSSSQAARGPG